MRRFFVLVATLIASTLLSSTRSGFAYSLSSGGDIPIPAKSVNGAMQSTWDGSYSDLLAADALAMCWTTQLDSGAHPAIAESDGIIGALMARMSTSSCKTTCSNSSYSNSQDLSICAYLDSRKDASCNVNPTTSEKQALDVSAIRASSQTQEYTLSSDAALGIYGAPSPYSALRASGQQLLAYTDLALCMAEQLHEKLDTAQVAFASSDDLVRVQELVRGYALVAVYQYSVIGKLFAVNAAPPTITNDLRSSTEWALAPLSIWYRNSFSSSTAKRWGDDFSEAIKLLVEATERSIELKMRDPQGQSSFGTPSFVASHNNVFTVPSVPGGWPSGLKGPREAILEDILYDGIDDTGSSGRLRGVQSDMSDPKVGVLLGLARSAGALKLSINGNLGPDIESSAENLLRAVDTYVTNLDCIKQGIPPSSCNSIPPWMPVNYLPVLQRYGFGMNQAKAITAALSEGLFGQPSRPPAPAGYDGLFEYRSDSSKPAWKNVPPAAQLSMHFFGSHQFTGTRVPLGYGDVIIDPQFSVAPLTASEIQSMRSTTAIPDKLVYPSMHAESQIGNIRNNIIGWTAATGYIIRRNVGSNTVLALARETLLQLSSAAAPANGIFAQAAPALGLIEKVIGTRQVILRHQKGGYWAGICPECGRQYNAAFNNGNGGVDYNMYVDEITKSSDPLSAVALAPAVPLAATLVRSPDTTTLFGGTQANSIANLTYQSPAVTSFAAAGNYSDYVMRQTAGAWSSNVSAAGVSVILRSSSAPYEYAHVYTGQFGITPYGTHLSSGSSTLLLGTVVTFGGQFERDVNKAWAFDPARWSVPQYDGFGLPRDWVPSTDASLFGDSGTSVQSHFLARASTAADESANALQQAFDNLQQQSIDTSAAQSNDTRAQQLTTLQYQSLCGAKQGSCKPSYSTMSLYIPYCPTTPSNPRCESFRTSLGRLIGTAGTGVPIAGPVAAAYYSGEQTPTFADYKGGSLQSLLVDEWATFLDLGKVLSSAVQSVAAAIVQVDAAQADLDAAKDEQAVVDADVTAAYIQVAITDQTAAAQQVEYNNNQATYASQLLAAQTTEAYECGDIAKDQARDAGYSYAWGGPGQVRVSEVEDDGTITVQFHNSTWSPGAFLAQADRCRSATTALQLAQKNSDLQTATMVELLKPLSLHEELTDAQQKVLPKRKAAAVAHVEAAEVKVALAKLGVGAQEVSATQSVQAGVARLLHSMVAIDQAFAQANVEASRIAIEQNQTNMDIRTRFGVRSRYHSYDLWRARALTENARRLAVAARRTIEARYVVDLSTMKAVEPFVEAPSVWADQIFSSDLKPFSIGRTQATVTGSGLNASAVKDYVNNLKLFLDGFAVERPSGAVLSDSEAIQLPAPAAQVLTTAHDASVAYIDPASSGWSFMCSNGTRISHPDVGKFFTGTPTWTLATACAGKPPVQARLSFNLDPWGRTQGVITNPPYAARYNVRTRALALNLVGSGIRSCQRTADPSTCYAEPFIRYDLKHVGPAWVTSYDQTWHSLNIPVAVIEAAKALSTEEWLDPVTNGFNRSDVSNIARAEFIDRPIGGAYELTLYLTPDVNVERIERLQLLAQTSYWVKQQ